MSTVSSVSSATSSVSSALSSAVSSSGTVSKDEFLQLLVTELKYQDPMNPQYSTQFVAQLATFSTLEQMTQLNTNMETSLELSAANLIGKTATVTDSTQTSGYTTGTIQGVQYYADGPAVKIGGTDYAFSSVQSIQ